MVPMTMPALAQASGDFVALLDNDDELSPDALFEVAADAIARTGDPTDGDALAEAIGATNLDTVVGKVQWGRDNVPEFARKNISKTPLVGGQWRKKDDGSFELVIVENALAPEVPLGGTLETLA